jgi:hypothetical protein
MQSNADRKMGRWRQRLAKPPITKRRKAMALNSEQPENPLIARAAQTVSDTYFIESWGLDGGMTALRNKIEFYQRVLAETEAFAATLTPEEYASIALMPTREVASATKA